MDTEANKSEPTLPVAAGRDTAGRFSPGNKLARGNPLNRRVQQLRARLIRTVKPADLQEIIQQLIDKGKAGDVIAAREVMDRVLGKPCQSELLERVERLEQRLTEGNFR